jgi:hypothetical protein
VPGLCRKPQCYDPKPYTLNAKPRIPKHPKPLRRLPYTLNPTARRLYSEYTAALAGQVAWNGDWSRTSPQWTFELKCALKPAPGPVRPMRAEVKLLSRKALPNRAPEWDRPVRARPLSRNCVQAAARSDQLVGRRDVRHLAHHSGPEPKTKTK